MVKTYVLVLCAALLELSLLPSLHAANANFNITAVLVDPVGMEVDQTDSNLSTKMPAQKLVAATLSTLSDPATQLHVSIAKNDTVVACENGACKGDKVELANLILKNLNYTPEKKLELDAIDKIALNDKPGLYSGDMTVLLATI